MNSSTNPGVAVNELIRGLWLPALDGLRFHATLLVFLVHSMSSVMLEYLRVPPTQFDCASPNPIYYFVYLIADGNHGVDPGSA